MCFAPIKIEELTVIRVDEEAREAVEKWVAQWNRLFEVDEDRVDRKYVSKSVFTAENPLKRLLLSVFEYLSVRDIETTAAYVCKSWYHVSKHPEHWKSRFISDFHPIETDPNSDYQRKYIAFVRNSCWNCRKLTALTDIKRKCRLNGQPLCTSCSRLKECRTVTLHSFCKEKAVAMATLERLKVPFFESYSGKACYLHIIVDKLMPHSEYRRKLLLLVLKDRSSVMLTDAEMGIIANFDLESFYKQEEKTSLCPFAKALAGFCGKNGVRESFGRSIDMLVNAIVEARAPAPPIS